MTSDSFFVVFDDSMSLVHSKLTLLFLTVHKEFGNLFLVVYFMWRIRTTDVIYSVIYSSQLGIEFLG